MFSFFIKKSEIVLDCFTFIDLYKTTFPPINSVDTYPQWFKSLPKNDFVNNNFVNAVPLKTMRRCVGILDFFRYSFTLPLWSDVIINTDKESYSYFFADNFSSIEMHNPRQHGNFISHYNHLKFVSPWLFFCKRDVKFLVVQPSWNFIDNQLFNENIFIVPGVVDFKYQHTTNVNAFITKKKNELKLNAGTPLLNFFPLTDKKIKIISHTITKQEFDSKSFSNNRFLGSYILNKKRLESH